MLKKWMERREERRQEREAWAVVERYAEALTESAADSTLATLREHGEAPTLANTQPMMKILINHGIAHLNKKQPGLGDLVSVELHNRGIELMKEKGIL